MQNQQSAYADILNEIRVRLLGINTILEGTSVLPRWLTAELGYLQLRMLCELVALGCLIAHGDIAETKSKKFQKEYAADTLIKMLENLHPNFFPVPIICQFQPENLHIDQRLEQDYLTKAELLALYHECGDHLHRGSLARIFSASKPKNPPKIENLIEWGQKFSMLLSQHKISSVGNTSHFVCFLSHEQANYEAFVVTAQLGG